MRATLLSLLAATAVLSLPAQPAETEPQEDPAAQAPAPAAPSEPGPVVVPDPVVSGSAVPADPAPVLPKAGDPNELTPAESMAWRDLREVVLRERAIWDRLREHPYDEYEKQRANADFRHVMTAYENVIRGAPKFAEAYAAYGLLLSRTGNREEAVRVFLKANQLDPNLPMVKNQIGNYLLEDGRYNEALGYYLAAIKLKPDEPLYHYQLGTLMHEYRRFFIDDGTYEAGKVDALRHEAFREAARLAPDNWPFIYRYAESFYDLEIPDWPGALEEWTRLLAKAKPGVEKQTIHLHQANVLARLGRSDEARAIVDSIVEPALEPAKAEVMALIDPPPAGDAAPPAEEAAPAEASAASGNEVHDVATETPAPAAALPESGP